MSTMIISDLTTRLWDLKKRIKETTLLINQTHKLSLSNISNNNKKNISNILNECERLISLNQKEMEEIENQARLNNCLYIFDANYITQHKDVVL